MSDKPITILLIEDNPNDLQLIKRALDKAIGMTFDLVCAVRLCEGLVILARGGIDVILLDLGLPDSRGLDTFTRAYAQAKDVPIVILSGLGDESLAIETLSKGAQDYLVKDQLGSNLLTRSIRYAISEKEAEEIPCGQGRILLMDDEEIVLEATGEVLKYLGFEVEFAKNGQEAIKLYKKAEESRQSFDLVIMDLTIPGGMGGKEAIGQLKKIYPRIKAVVFSGYSNDPVTSDPEKHGFCGVLNKPYKIKEMGKILQKVLSIED